MIRTPSRALAAAILAGAFASGCATFSDNDLAARVGDAELTHDGLADQLQDPATGESPQLVDGVVARNAIREWIFGSIAGQSGLYQRYTEGDDSLGVACYFVLPAVDRLQAEQVVDRVTGGEAWDDVIESVQPGSSLQSRQPCVALDDLIPGVADTLRELDANGTPQVLELDDPAGVFVVRAHTVDELDTIEFINAVAGSDPESVDSFVAELDAADIYVDPRYGAFDTEQFSVIPVG